MTEAGPQIYLASRSPRRGELLTQIGVRFALVAADTDETRWSGESAEDYAIRVALDKARAGRGRLPGEDRRPVLGADTVVVLDDQVLGKPRDREDAAAMLRGLSGRSHRVLTAVALLADEREWTALCESRVSFRPIRDAELERYWLTGEPRDKAGGYGIQGYGALFIAGIEGSYSGVMGLPLFETGRLLEEAGVELMAEAISAV